MFGEITKSATRLVLLLLVFALVIALFTLRVNNDVLSIFKDALLLVLGAYFGAKGNGSSSSGDDLAGK